MHDGSNSHPLLHLPQAEVAVREPEEENFSVDSPAGSLVASSEILGSPTYNYSAMLNREDSRDIPEQDFIPQPPAREVFREPSEAHTYGVQGGYGNNRFSNMADVNAGRMSGSGNATATAGVFTRGSLLDRNIEAVSEPTPGFLEKTQQKYKGRYRVRTQFQSPKASVQPFLTLA